MTGILIIFLFIIVLGVVKLMTASQELRRALRQAEEKKHTQASEIDSLRG